MSQWLTSTKMSTGDHRPISHPTPRLPEEATTKSRRWMFPITLVHWRAYAIPDPMSFSRHAYRRALKPPAPTATDHVWISDDLLAAAFRRFANGQRRHGSCIPGPLEARRRLAKRRNTALAGIGGSPAEDIASLFGRNGREHMKWTDHPWQRAQPETRGMPCRRTA